MSTFIQIEIAFVLLCVIALSALLLSNEYEIKKARIKKPTTHGKRNRRK